MFNPHHNVTADGVLITEGLRVFTNELNVGVIVSDDTNGEYMCCHDNTDGTTHPKGQFRPSGTNVWFTDHAAAQAPNACKAGCRHDHWFTVSTDQGTKSFNGERIATVFEGRKA